MKMKHFTSVVFPLLLFHSNVFSSHLGLSPFLPPSLSLHFSLSVFHKHTKFIFRLSFIFLCSLSFLPELHVRPLQSLFRFWQNVFVYMSTCLSTPQSRRVSTLFNLRMKLKNSTSLSCVCVCVCKLWDIQSSLGTYSSISQFVKRTMFIWFIFLNHQWACTSLGCIQFSQSQWALFCSRGQTDVDSLRHQGNRLKASRSEGRELRNTEWKRK